VVEGALNHKSGELTAKCLAAEFYGDIEAENTVIKMAAAVRDALRSYYEDKGSNDIIQIEIPKGSFVPVFRFIEKRESRSDSTRKALVEKQETPRWKRFGYLGVAVVALGVGWTGHYFYSSWGAAFGPSGLYIEVCCYPKEIDSKTHLLSGKCSPGEYKVLAYIGPDDDSNLYWLQGPVDARSGDWSLNARFGDPLTEGPFVFYLVLCQGARVSKLPGWDDKENKPFVVDSAEEFEQSLVHVGVAAFKKCHIFRKPDKCARQRLNIVSPKQPDNSGDRAQVMSPVNFEWQPSQGYPQLYQNGALRTRESEEIKTQGSGAKIDLKPGRYEFKIKDPDESECETGVWFDVLPPKSAR
jgi:hypothetical protein